MGLVTQGTSFGDIHIQGQGNNLVVNNVVQISVSEVKTRSFVPGSPYLGLRRFEERHKDFYFGRDLLVAQLVQLISQHNLILVAGASGSGKSSAVRAGVLPHLSAHFAQGRFRALVLTPDRDPFSSLRGALLAIGMPQAQLEALDAATADSLYTTLTSLRPTDELWLLFVDQFEELFTLCQDAGRQKAFLDGLTRIAQAPQQEIKIALAMRADFFDRFGPHPEFASLATLGLQLVTDMQPSELRSAIEQPAARHGVVFEEGLVEQIIADVKGRAGALPLLQYTLDLLWREDNPAADRTMNLASYHRVGGVEGALRQRADALYRFENPQKQTPRPPAQQELMRKIFLRVVDLTAQGADARVVSRRAPLAIFALSEERRLIAGLVDDKLLVSNAPLHGDGAQIGSTIELAHEALLSAWPTLKDWINQGREVIYVRNRLAADARRYAETKARFADKADEELWAGSRLQQAAELCERGDFKSILGGLTTEEQSFVDASLMRRESRLREETARREQRTRFLRVGVALLSVFLVIAAGAALYARQQQRHAEQRELDVYVEEGWQLLTEKDRPIDALLWLHRAYERGSHHPRLRQLISSAVRPVDAVRLILQGPAGAVYGVSYRPDGRQIATAGEDKTARIWDAERGNLLLTLSGHSDRVHSVAYSADGHRIITTSRDKTARIWDADTGRFLFRLAEEDDFIKASYSPDGRTIVTSGNKSRLWDAQNGQVILTLGDQSTSRVSYSPDASQILTSNEDTVSLWDAKTGRLVFSLPGEQERFAEAAFSPDGTNIVTTQPDAKKISVWSAKSGDQRFTFRTESGRAFYASYSPDGSRIFTTSILDGQILVFNADNGTLLNSFSGHSGIIYDSSFSADGRRIATASADGTVRIWDVEESPIAFRIPSDPPGDASFSKDRRRLIIGDGKTARIWDVDSGKLLRTLNGHGKKLSSASFSPDGRRLVTSSADQTARIWDADSGQLLRTLTGLSKYSNHLEFSPDSRKVVGSMLTSSTQVWDADSGKSLFTLNNHF